MAGKTDNPKKAFGALKPCLSYVPMSTMLQVGRVFELGARKYGKKNWRVQPVDASTYYDAALRHLIEFFEQGIDADAESGQSPLAHVIACCMIVMDGLQRGELKDDRREYVVLTKGETLEGNMEKQSRYVVVEAPMNSTCHRWVAMDMVRNVPMDAGSKEDMQELCDMMAKESGGDLASAQLSSRDAA